jgi:hypothetical protein
VSPARDVSKFRFPIFARANPPALRAGTNVLVYQPREDSLTLDEARRIASNIALRRESWQHPTFQI